MLLPPDDLYVCVCVSVCTVPALVVSTCSWPCSKSTLHMYRQHQQLHFSPVPASVPYRCQHLPCKYNTHLYTIHPTQYTPPCRLYAFLYTIHYAPFYILYTPLCTPPHNTLHTLLYNTLYIPCYILYILPHTTITYIAYTIYTILYAIHEPNSFSFIYLYTI